VICTYHTCTETSCTNINNAVTYCTHALKQLERHTNIPTHKSSQTHTTYYILSYTLFSSAYQIIFHTQIQTPNKQTNQQPGPLRSTRYIYSNIFTVSYCNSILQYCTVKSNAFWELNGILLHCCKITTIAIIVQYNFSRTLNYGVL
jgi:hypothetical protein